MSAITIKGIHIQKSTSCYCILTKLEMKDTISWYTGGLQGEEAWVEQSAL
jgi:hypothetical protein